jgi:hypothetical protein
MFVVTINSRGTTAECETLTQAAMVAVEECDAAPKIYDTCLKRWVSGAEILLAAISGTKRKRLGD